VKTILHNKRTLGGKIITDLKLYYWAAVFFFCLFVCLVGWLVLCCFVLFCLLFNRMLLVQTQTDWSVEMNWRPEIKPHTYGFLIFNKKTKNIKWKKRRIFKEWCHSNCQSLYVRVKMNSILFSFAKVKSKLINDIHI